MSPVIVTFFVFKAEKGKENPHRSKPLLFNSFTKWLSQCCQHNLPVHLHSVSSPYCPSLYLLLLFHNWKLHLSVFHKSWEPEQNYFSRPAKMLICQQHFESAGHETTLHWVSRLIPLVSSGVKVHLECVYSAFIGNSKNNGKCSLLTSESSALSTFVVKDQLEAKAFTENCPPTVAPCVSSDCSTLPKRLNWFQKPIFRDLEWIVMLEKVCESGALLLLNSFSCQSHSPWRQCFHSLETTWTKCVNPASQRPAVFCQLGKSVFLELVCFKDGLRLWLSQIAELPL